MDVITKEKQLINFINKYKHLAAQGTADWKKGRVFNIGGSEMSIVEGVNYFKKEADLVSSHLGITVFHGNFDTFFGSVLEDLTTELIEKMWHCKIYETGSLPGAVPNQRYSPDGLAYVKFLDMIVLFEFKSPPRRVPTGVIPVSYIPQIKTGLDTIPIADIAVFVDVAYRICSLNNFGYSSAYNCNVHPDKKMGIPWSRCMMGVYDPQIKQDNDEPRDFGECEKKEMKDLMQNIKEHRYLKYFTPIDNPDVEDGSAVTMLQNCKDASIKLDGAKLIGIVPLKIFKICTATLRRGYDVKDIQNPKVGYVKKLEPKIKRIVDNIKYLSQFSDEKLLDEYHKIYPSRFYIPSNIKNDLVQDMFKIVMDMEENSDVKCETKVDVKCETKVDVNYNAKKIKNKKQLVNQNTIDWMISGLL